MREIKFRVWDDSVGAKAYYSGDSIFISGHGRSLVDEFGEYLDENNTTKIEQYTGIKDVNGVEIYEGDLILANGIEYEVEWFNTSFWAIPHSGVGSSQPISNLYEYDGKNIEKIRVIANIHDDENVKNYGHEKVEE